MNEEDERFVACANGLYEFGVWDIDRDQWAITGYANDGAGGGREAAEGAAARMNVREAFAAKYRAATAS